MEKGNAQLYIFGRETRQKLLLHTNIIKEIEKTIIFFPNSIIFIRFGREIIIIRPPNHIYQQYFK
jgi:hypothetical protein